MTKPSTNRFRAALACAPLGLSLCVAGIAAAQMESPAAASADAESKQPGTDALITSKVKTKLAMTQGVPSTRIEVTTRNGTVSLSGTVDDKDPLQKTVIAAQSVKGVREVNSTALKSKE